MNPAEGRRPRRATISGEADGLVRSPEAAAAEAADALAVLEVRPPLVRRLPADAADGRAGQARWEVVVGGWRFEVAVEDGARAALRARAERGGAHATGTARLVVRAQIPGRVVSVGVADGESVEAGQRLLSVEAMKMENEIRAPRVGRVERIAVRPGQRVERGDELAVLV